MTGDFSLQNTAADIGRKIRKHRLMEFPAAWGSELLFPHYEGYSVYNFAHTLTALFGMETGHPLDASITTGDSLTGVQRVVVLLTDGLGYNTLLQTIHDHPDLHADIHAITQGRGAVPLTSVLPTTTATVLPTIWAGAVPAVTGMLGTILHLREFGAMGDMLKYAPHIGHSQPDAFAAWGHPAEDFVPVPGIPQRMTAAGIDSHLALDFRLMGTGLSKILHRGITHQHPHAGGSDVWLRYHDVLRQTRGQRCYVSFYLPNVDGLSHMYGARSPYVIHEIKQQFAALRELLTYDDVQDGQTVVFIIADHGHADMPTVIDLERDAYAAPIRATLRQPLGGEARFAYVHAQEPQVVVETINTHYADQLAAITTADALQAGFFGPGTPHPDVLHRIGDVILTGRAGVQVVDRWLAQPKMVSSHGGLTDAEMLVPLMWARI